MAVSNLTAVLGTCRRSGRWEVSKTTSALVVFGRCHVDYRMASADPELERITVKIFCLFGALTMIMRPGTDVRPSVVNLLASSRCDVEDGPLEGEFPAVVLEITTLFGRCRVLSNVDEGEEDEVEVVEDAPQRRAADQAIEPATLGTAAAAAPAPEPDRSSIDASSAFGEPEPRDPVSLLGATVATLSETSTALPETTPEPLPTAGGPSRKSAASMFEPVRSEDGPPPAPAAPAEPAFLDPTDPVLVPPAAEPETTDDTASMADLMFADQLETATSADADPDGAADAEDEEPAPRRLDALDPEKAVDLEAGPTIRITA